MSYITGLAQEPLDYDAFIKEVSEAIPRVRAAGRKSAAYR